MANNIIQVKRTSTSGRTPNTTSVSNNQYITAGELALNMADGILYTSNGSALISIGANNRNVSVTGNLTVNAIIANGSTGPAGYALFSNGTSTYWASPSAGSVDQSAQYTWTNTQTFSNTITFSSTINGTANNSLYLGGVAAASYVQNTDSRTLSGNLVFTANITVKGVIANGSLGTTGQVLSSNGSSTFWSTPSSVTVSNTAPSSPSQGNLWWDTDVGIMYIYYNDGTSAQWVESTPPYQAVTISNTAPVLPSSGDLWWDPSVGNMFVYYSNTFVQAVPSYLIQGPIGTFTLSGNLITTGDMTVQGTLYETSDISLKENIETFSNALDTVKSLRGVSFDWKKHKNKSAGVIAQEIEEVLPYLVNREYGGTKTVNYTAIIGILIEAIKELSDRIENK